MNSIIQTKKECYFCGLTGGLHNHHVYGGRNRTISDINGFTVYLCPEHHNMSKDSVHMSEKRALILKRNCQKEYEKTHTREQFIALIGRNYLED